MTFDDLKDQAKDKIGALWAQFQETSLHAAVREKYDNLSPTAQKLLIAGLAALASGLLLLIPLSYFASSSDSVASFEARKSLVKELFRTQRESDSLKSAPGAVGAADLQARAQAKLATLGLAPEQIAGVTGYDNAVAGKPSVGIPKAVEQTGISVALKNLNVTQIAAIGYKLQTIDSSVKIVGMQASASATAAHYFDVTYRLVSFSMPAEAEPLPAAKDKAGGKKLKLDASPKPVKDTEDTK